ncbi:AraC family transcriptional regulator [Mycobacterium sp. PS03-16]|nr:AraC family transcriptional regulator [Mycobacterium sp. PS03-16]
MRPLVECGWLSDGPGRPVHVLPDGCMDLIRMDGRVVVAGPDTVASRSVHGEAPVAGLRFRPGVLPRLLGVPASALRNVRVPLADVVRVPEAPTLTALALTLAADAEPAQSAPWTLGALRHVTGRVAGGASVAEVAAELGRSPRTLQRQCTAVYGYGPATLRRVLRFRRAVRMLRDGVPYSEVAARTGYADQPHLHREVRALAGMSLSQLASGAYRSTEVPSGSATVA